MYRSESRISVAWRQEWANKRFRWALLLSIISLLLCGAVAPLIFQYAEHRPGMVLNDFLLEILPPINVSNWIFSVIYLLIALSVTSLCSFPRNLLLGIVGYVLLTILRFGTILLFPLEAPQHIVELRDPIVEKLFYQAAITKDLFFSGHTSILILLGLVNPHKSFRLVLYLGAMVIGLLVLVQHAHYTIDVLAAPLFAFLAYWLALKVLIKTELK